MAASAAAEHDVESAGKALLLRRGRRGGCLGDVVVDDGRSPYVDGPRNGEDHVGEAGVVEDPSPDGGVEAAVAA
jgi:hypothetical protein